MCHRSPRCRLIKVLTDLENGPTRVSIDMQVLKDLKRHPSKKMLAAREIILEIVDIVDILLLLQTIKRSRGTGPRATFQATFFA